MDDEEAVLKARERDVPWVVEELGLSDEVVAQLGALWGKSAQYGGGRLNLLLGHLLDTAAVAERMWEEYLAPSVKDLLDAVSGDDGRRFFMWLCGVHDCGKATPAHQALDEEGSRRVRAAGLMWSASALRQKRWRHDKAGGKVVRDVLGPEWAREAVEWVWPIVAGHHGSFPSVGVFRTKQACGEWQGRGAWKMAQRALMEVFARCLGYRDVAAVEPVAVPSKAEQLALSGLVVMADWIASDTREGRFAGIDRLEELGLARARERAEVGWRALKLRGGWGQLSVPGDGDLIERRFGQQARASQQQLVECARRLPVPGLMFVEAPMGEGKTKGALAAAEVLAARFGADGVFVGMPTQATCDPMFTTVRDWVANFSEDLPDQVALLHGKRMFHPQWRGLWEPSAGGEGGACFGSVGEDGLDEFGLACDAECGCRGSEGEGPSEWFLGRHRGLLSPFVVGTIDQLLFAAARVKHVMPRFAGLAGKVVVLDEVHAADVYMSQFLEEGLRWLGQAGVAVVLLSATLAPEQRRRLARAYAEGATGRSQVDLSAMPDPEGYPSVSAVCAEGTDVRFDVDSSWPWRESIPVQVQWLADLSTGTSERGAAGLIAKAVEDEVREGGVALAVLNTVARAQEVHELLEQAFPSQVRLLHGRLCAAHRAEATECCLDALGPEPSQGRPKRAVVVATQLAEQSFDVDADVLITDLAPIDLLLQRIGRLHRHASTPRPRSLRTPRVLVTGVSRGSLIPRMLKASEGIYGRYLLLRTAALLVDQIGLPGGDQGTFAMWSIPEQVPELVGAVYGKSPVCRAEWTDAEVAAQIEWDGRQRERADHARAQVLTRQGEWERRTLAGLHNGGNGHSSEEKLRALVRDGEPSAEVVIVHRGADGYRAVDGTWLGTRGEASHEVREAVLGGTTRLPAREELTAAVESELRPLNGWLQVPWLKYAKALVLEETTGCAQVGGFSLSYDEVRGLSVERC